MGDDNTVTNNQYTISTYGIIFMCIISIQVLLFYSNLYNSEYYILELDKFFLISKLVLIFIIICYNPVYDTNRSLCNLNLECNSFDYNKFLFLLYTIGIYIVYTIGSIHCIENN